MHLIVCRLWSSRRGMDPASRWFSRSMWNSCMSTHSHGEIGYGEATEPARDGLAMLSARSPDRNVGVTGVCGYPRPAGRAGHGSTRSVNGELSTVVNCPGQMDDSRVAVLPKLRGLSQKPGWFDIKQTYTTALIKNMPNWSEENLRRCRLLGREYDCHSYSRLAVPCRP